MEWQKYVLYINLDHRVDRKDYVLGQLATIGVMNPERFPAIKMTAGNVGCALSHIRCIEMAKARGWPQVLICEDDITFMDASVFMTSLGQFLESEISWDVLVLGGNNCPPFSIISDYYVRVHNIQTTTGYIVKKEYYDVLLANFKEGLANLLREPEKKKLFSIDIWWKHLQQTDRWFLLTPLTVVQAYDFSDIEGKMTDYRRMMLDLDKRELIERLMREQKEKKDRFSMGLL
jgi:GR25 family glycosyltransferase involved in LPS biosynthesis